MRCFQIRENTRIDNLMARDQFKDLQPGEVRTVSEKGWVYRSWIRIAVTLSLTGERVIVEPCLSVLNTFPMYQKRWAGVCVLSC